MDNQEFYIDFPDESIIQKQIDTIIVKGVKPKEAFYSYLKNMSKQIGIRYLFHDMTEIVFTVLIVLSVIIFVAVTSGIKASIDNGSIYSFIFMFSPILYLAVSLVAFINTKQRGTYEIEMTCKYNIYQLAVFRMLVFSVFCIIINISVLGLVFVFYKQVNLLQALMLSITSLFLFSTTFLYVIFKIHSKYTKYFMVFIWMLANIWASIFSSELYNMFLNKIPVYVYLAVIAVGACAYIRNLKTLITFKNVEGVI